MQLFNNYHFLRTNYIIFAYEMKFKKNFENIKIKKIKILQKENDKER